MRTFRAILGGFLFAIAGATPALAGSPPPDLVKLERLVSLELAHVRDLGPTDQAARKRLSEAHQLDLDGEKAMASGDYKTAEDKFLRARVLIRDLASQPEPF